LFHEVNVTGTLNVLEAARAAGVSRIAFAASSSAYGDSETLPKIESMRRPRGARTPRTKSRAKSLMSAYAASYGLDTASAALFQHLRPAAKRRQRVRRRHRRVREGAARRPAADDLW